MGRAISLKEAQERETEKDEEEQLAAKLARFLERFEAGNDLSKLLSPEGKQE